MLLAIDEHDKGMTPEDHADASAAAKSTSEESEATKMAKEVLYGVQAQAAETAKKVGGMLHDVQEHAAEAAKEADRMLHDVGAQAAEAAEKVGGILHDVEAQAAAKKAGDAMAGGTEPRANKAHETPGNAKKGGKEAGKKPKKHKPTPPETLDLKPEDIE